MYDRIQHFWLPIKTPFRHRTAIARSIVTRPTTQLNEVADLIVEKVMFLDTIGRFHSTDTDCSLNWKHTALSQVA